MAANPRTEHKNRHAGYMAGTGGGKSTMLRQNIPASGVRVVLWDIDRDHRATHIESFRVFVRELGKAHRSRKPFRLAYSGDDSPELFERFCRAVWCILDGNLPTLVIVEELADLERSAGKASPWWGKLLRKGRKFGAAIHWTTQRPQEVSKTAVTQAGTLYVGKQNSYADGEIAARYANTTPAKIDALQPLEFFQKTQLELEPRYIDLRGIFTRKTGDK